jgi:hypothetical protein
MKTPRLLASCAFLLISFTAALRAGPVDSHISAATVYLDRAVVTRTAIADLAAGEHSLVFERLPANLLDQSLQASGHGTANATILDVSAQTAYVDFTPNARVKDLEDQFTGLQKQLRVLADRAQILNEERDFVKRMLLASTPIGIYPAGADATHGGVAVRPTLDEWQKLYTYSEDSFGKIAAELQSISCTIC